MHCLPACWRLHSAITAAACDCQKRVDKDTYRRMSPRFAPRNGIAFIYLCFVCKAYFNNDSSCADTMGKCLHVTASIVSTYLRHWFLENIYGFLSLPAILIYVLECNCSVFSNKKYIEHYLSLGHR